MTTRRVGTRNQRDPVQRSSGNRRAGDALARLDAAVNAIAISAARKDGSEQFALRLRAYRRALQALLKERADAAATVYELDAGELGGHPSTYHEIRAAVLGRGRKAK